MKKAAMFALLLLVSSLARADGVCGDKGKMQEGACTQEDSFIIGPGVSLSFLTHWTASDEISAVKIDVLNGDQPVQTLEASGMTAPSLSLSAQDMNFDGFADLLLLVNAGASGNANFMLWVFDPSSKKFVAFSQFKDYVSPVPDPKLKVITSHSNDGHAGLMYVEKTFKWNDSTLGKIAEERQGALLMPGHYHNLRWELVNGKPTLVSERIFVVDDDGTEEEQLCISKAPAPGCGPIAAIIDFTGAEAEKDLEGMLNAYGSGVIWQGEPRDAAFLRANHGKWLGSITDYTLKVNNFRSAFSDAQDQAQVRCDVAGIYKDAAGKGHAFKIGKQFLLVRDDKNRWFISCEETNQLISGGGGKTTDACQL